MDDLAAAGDDDLYNRTMTEAGRFTLWCLKTPADLLPWVFKYATEEQRKIIVSAASHLIRVRGRAEVEARGRAEGELDVLRAVLLSHVEHRFGPPSPEVVTRIEGATRDDLEAWTDRVLSAPTLASLLDTATAPHD